MDGHLRLEAWRQRYNRTDIWERYPSVLLKDSLNDCRFIEST